MAQLETSVFVTDPDTHHTVELAPGTCPEPKLAALVTNPAAWVNRELPDLAEAQDTPQGDASAEGSDSAGDKQVAPAAKKPAAKKSAPAPARGRAAAGEGASGA
jgi:hypothetical protein